MARDWAKWHVAQLDDPDFLSMPAESYRVFGLAVAMAARQDEDGCCGTLKRFAWVIHETEDDVRGWIEGTDGRLSLEDGRVCVRDWLQWQNKRWDPTAAERKARWQDAQNEPGTGGNATERNGTPKNAEQSRAVKSSSDEMREDETRGNAAHAADSSPPSELLTAALHVCRPKLSKAKRKELEGYVATWAERGATEATVYRACDLGDFEAGDWWPKQLNHGVMAILSAYADWIDR